MKSPFVSHIEWSCTDLARSELFFQRLFGWRFQRHGKNYSLFTPEQHGGPCVGLLRINTVIASQTCHAFIEVANIASILDQALILNAKTVVDITDIPNYGGCYAQITDPDDNRVGLFEKHSPSKT
ncbi:MAG: hypothetical protein GXP08_14490 [Gammaproteobacteria bacterium]|nr:hypothetical protein [Gammaproteobacteria bacterium]